MKSENKYSGFSCSINKKNTDLSKIKKYSNPTSIEKSILEKIK